MSGALGLSARSDKERPRLRFSHCATSLLNLRLCCSRSLLGPLRSFNAFRHIIGILSLAMEEEAAVGTGPVGATLGQSGLRWYVQSEMTRDLQPC